VPALDVTIFSSSRTLRFTRWILDLVGEPRSGHLREVGCRSATAVSGYLRGQATVGLIDGVFIGIGLAVIGVAVLLHAFRGGALFNEPFVD
jgi:predicted PurR-regulated permease PerM